MFLDKRLALSIFQKMVGRQLSMHYMALAFPIIPHCTIVLFMVRPLSGYLLFAIWRDTVSKFVSSYFYLKDYSSSPVGREFASRVYGNTDSPVSLVDKMVEDRELAKEILGWSHFSPQYSFVSDLSGE